MRLPPTLWIAIIGLAAWAAPAAAAACEYDVHTDAELDAANLDVSAGCTVWLHEPLDGRGRPAFAYQQAIRPRASGLPGRPITYRAAPGEAPRFADAAARTHSQYVCVNLLNSAHIVIDGIHCGGDVDEALQTGRWRAWTWVLTNTESHHVTIQNSTFTASRRHGVELRGPGSNVVRDNVMIGAGHPCADTGHNEPVDAMAELLNLRTSDTLVEGNVMSLASHNVLEIPSEAGVRHTGNVIRGNDLSNPWNRIVTLDSLAGGNVFEHNSVHESWTQHTAMKRLCSKLYPDAPPLEPPNRGLTVGGGDVIRYNRVFLNAYKGFRAVAKTTPVHDYAGARIYGNVFAWNGEEGFDSFGFLDGAYRFHHNILFENSHPLLWGGDGVQIRHGSDGSTPLGPNVHERNLVHSSLATGLVETKVPGNVSTLTLLELESLSEPGLPVYAENLDVDPGVRDASFMDFRPLAGSPLVDAGAPLARLRRAAVNSTLVKLDDARWFSAGVPALLDYADTLPAPEVRGDRVRFGNGEVRRVVDVDRDRHILFLDAPVSAADGESVSPFYHGAAPDIGRHEWTHLIHEDFDRYSNRHGPGNPGDGNPDDWIVTEAGQRVIQTFRDGEGGGRVAKIQTGGSRWSLVRWFDRARPGSPADRPVLRLRLRLRPQDTTGSTLAIRLDNPDRVFDVRVDGDAVRGHDGDGLITVFDGLEEGRWVTIVASADFRTGTWTLSVTPEDGSPPVVQELAFTTAGARHPNRLRIHHGPPPYRVDVEIDDVELEWLSD